MAAIARTMNQYHTTEALLTADEEQALGLRVRAGDAGAVNELVRRNVRLVIRFASRRRPPPGMETDDLIQHGMIGLHKAARRFDPVGHPGVRFSTHAMHWIRQAINQAILDEGYLIRSPRYIRDVERDIRRGRPITMRQRACVAASRRLMTGHRLDGLFGDLEPSCHDLPGLGLERTEDVGRLRLALDALDERSRLVIRARYFEGRKLAAVAAEVGLTRERVRQIQVEAVARLRRAMGAEWSSSRLKIGPRRPVAEATETLA